MFQDENLESEKDAKSGYHSFFPFSIANQKSNTEKLNGYFVFCFFIITPKMKKSLFFQISLLGSDQKYEMENGHQDRIWF